MSQIINMILCPHCEENWIREDDEAACEQCMPAYEVDIAVASLITAVNDLLSQPTPEVRVRINLLIDAHNKLTELIKKAKPKPRKK